MDFAVALDAEQIVHSFMDVFSSHFFSVSLLHQVSIFLKDKVQNSNGRFVLPTSGPVPHGTQVPGLIRQDMVCFDSMKQFINRIITPNSKGLAHDLKLLSVFIGHF